MSKRLTVTLTTTIHRVSIVRCNLQSIINNAVSQFANLGQTRIIPSGTIRPQDIVSARLGRRPSLCLTSLNSRKNCAIKWKPQSQSMKHNLLRSLTTILHNNSLPVAMHLNFHTATSETSEASLFNEFFESVYSKPLSPYSHYWCTNPCSE